MPIFPLHKGGANDPTSQTLANDARVRHGQEALRQHRRAIFQETMDFGIAPYRVVGQLFDCYWVVQQGDRVFFIDQHAAHER